MKAAFLAVLLLAGCAAKEPVTIIQKVPVPVKCQAVVPVRPVMPTETIGVADFFVQSRAAFAEIDFREAYEVELLAALLSCL
jgi:uncharacterized lipoprotein YajG